jgi:hypothetical protein
MMPGRGPGNIALNPILRPIPGRAGRNTGPDPALPFRSLSCLHLQPGHPCRAGTRAGGKTGAAPATASAPFACPAMRATRAR